MIARQFRADRFFLSVSPQRTNMEYLISQPRTKLIVVQNGGYANQLI